MIKGTIGSNKKNARGPPYTFSGKGKGKGEGGPHQTRAVSYLALCRYYKKVLHGSEHPADPSGKYGEIT